MPLDISDDPLCAYVAYFIVNPFRASTLDQGSVQNIVIVPMAVATSVAAIFIEQAWIQRLALAIQIGGWIVYFAVFQSALSE